MHHCNRVLIFVKTLTTICVVPFIKTLALHLMQKSQDTLRKSTNIKTLVSGHIRPKIAKQSFFSTENICKLFETTARCRQVKVRDDANKLSERDHNNPTPRSSIGPDEYARPLKQTQLDHSFDPRTSNKRTKARYKKNPKFWFSPSSWLNNCLWRDARFVPYNSYKQRIYRGLLISTNQIEITTGKSIAG